MKFFFTFLIAAFACLPAFAADGEFALNYRKKNRWVAQDDIKSLRTLLSESKKKGVNHFFVRIPEDNRGLTIERLVVLRDILEKSLKQSIVIEEVPGDAKSNQIVIMFEYAVIQKEGAIAPSPVAPMATPSIQTEEISN